MKKFLLALAAACLLALALRADSVVEEIVARVNDGIITRSDYDRAKENMVNELRQQDPSAAKLAAQEKDALRDLIDQRLLLQKAKDLDITGENQVIKRLDEIRKQMNLETMDDLEKAAREQGVSFEDFKENLRQQIVTQEVIRREVGSHLTVTKEEEQAFYQQHKSEFEQPEQVRLSEILISTDPKPGQENEDETARLAPAKAKADQLLAEIKAGKKFEDVAKTGSDGPTAAQGGDLGYFKRGALAKELEDTTFAMKPGELSNVVRTKQGYIILEVTEHDQAGAPPLDKVEDKIGEAVYLEKLQPALRDYLTKLRENAYIDIKEGYVDTAASPNETKPVFTTATTAPKTKKKRKKRFLIF